MGSTTYQEYRHFERDRALVAAFPEGRRARALAGRVPSHPEGAGAALRGAPRRALHRRPRSACVDLAVRHLNDRFLPDKAIDVMDETGAAVRLRPVRRGPRKTVGVRDVERVVAAAWRGCRSSARPEPIASRLENLEPDLKQVVFGQDREPSSSVASAIKRSRAGLGGSRAPDRLLPLHRSDGRRQDRAEQAARDHSPGRALPALRHERVHGEARGLAADRSATGLRRATTRAGS